MDLNVAARARRFSLRLVSLPYYLAAESIMKAVVSIRICCVCVASFLPTI